MIYDQALFVNLPESKRRFTANFKYTVKQSISDYSKLSSNDFSKFNSHCNSTMIGFIQTSKKWISCAYAVQISASNINTIVSEDKNGAFIA